MPHPTEGSQEEEENNTINTKTRKPCKQQKTNNSPSTTAQEAEANQKMLEEGAGLSICDKLISSHFFNVIP